MTEEEFRKLRRGELVEYLSGKRWRRGVITWAARHNERKVQVLREGLNSAGYRYDTVNKLPKELRHLRPLESLTANVYADWLEEHHFVDAAIALRQEFPIAQES